MTVVVQRMNGSSLAKSEALAKSAAFRETLDPLIPLRIKSTCKQTVAELIAAIKEAGV